MSMATSLPPSRSWWHRLLRIDPVDTRPAQEEYVNSVKKRREIDELMSVHRLHRKRNHFSDRMADEFSREHR